ncbi:hypothetical protein [Paenibacillus glucanolyticus]|uniref:hypothetical protein n=1 Tax=Paenibacillus glucanolyticus TaxID=59843 RepID=UPI0030CE2BE0
MRQLGLNLREDKEYLLSLSKKDYVKVMQANFGQRIFTTDDGQERHVTFLISVQAFEQMYDKLHGINLQ